ncbi:MAG: hypothetical protein IPK82_09385 [Polyangiaceae bacterium]|nr:hypothetical protein [Polyangiaceae bacterium]
MRDVSAVTLGELPRSVLSFACAAPMCTSASAVFYVYSGSMSLTRPPNVYARHW